jgi:2-keto-4-pentenoate hydratase
MSLVWDDPRVRAGMRTQLAARARRLAAGERHRGWKVAFTTQAALDRLGVGASLIGFFTDGNVLEPGADVPLDGWTTPVLEPEVALELGRDLRGGAGYDEARAAIAGVAPAVELADFDASLMDDVTAVLAGDIFHRFMVLGDFTPAGAVDLADLTARVECDGALRAVVEAPASVSGDLVEVLRHTADYLEGIGEQLSAGDVVMTGSVTPVIGVAAGERWTFTLDPLGTVAVSFARRR